MKSKVRKAVYAASLDPITNGHLNVIKRMAPLYDELVVVVAVDSRKTYTFSQKERAEMAKAAVARFPNVTVDVCIGRYVVKLAEELGAQVVLRGLRDFKDLRDEQALAEANRKICSRIDSKIETIWLPCLPDLTYVSSSTVKDHMGADPDWEEEVADMVPHAVLVKLKEKHILGKARKHWASLMATLGKPAGSEMVLNDLLTRYSEPHRAYHNLGHVVSMLDDMTLLDEDEANSSSVAAIALATWFHDAVYDTAKAHPRIASNEARSAFLAEGKMKEMGLASNMILRVKDLIMATNHTFVPTDRSAKVVVELDLAILGKSKREFDAYEAGIRKEYSWVPWPDFSRVRKATLEKFLARDPLFSTPSLRKKYESAAEKNLSRSVRRLLK